MPFAAKVHALQTEISGNERLVILRNCQNGRVIADSRHNVPPVSCTSTDAGDQRLFGQWHGDSHYSEKLCRNWSPSLGNLTAQQLHLSNACTGATLVCTLKPAGQSHLPGLGPR